jgi:hypothetical protein
MARTVSLKKVMPLVFLAISGSSTERTREVTTKKHPRPTRRRMRAKSPR